jgi:hypothetical protein
MATRLAAGLATPLDSQQREQLASLLLWELAAFDRRPREEAEARRTLPKAAKRGAPQKWNWALLVLLAHRVDALIAKGKGRNGEVIDGIGEACGYLAREPGWRALAGRTGAKNLANKYAKGKADAEKRFLEELAEMGSPLLEHQVDWLAGIATGGKSPKK